ncbi:protein HIGH CHLOROPHYLL FLUORESCENCE PHENOTYPE 173, chloroplastic isoform X7 [Malus domestica]|uniref:protein HIGH CHLOROPHYLL FLUORESCENCE PHENOTYPE 173, chloroplastic isoform X7 n=1 Tax=Malus domestica TaxID=3750 RepID=UPI003976D834
MGEKWHRLMQNLFGDQSEEEEEEVDSEHESNPHPNSGCNKIIYYATAGSTISGDLYRVDQRGVYNLTKALQDYNNKMVQLRAGKSCKSKLTIVKFKTPESVDGWEVRQGTYFQDVVASMYDGGMDAEFEFTFTRDAVFSTKRRTEVGF